MLKLTSALVLCAAMATADDRVWSYEQIVFEAPLTGEEMDYMAQVTTTVQWINSIQVRTDDEGANWTIEKTRRSTFALEQPVELG